MSQSKVTGRCLRVYMTVRKSDLLNYTSQLLIFECYFEHVSLPAYMPWVCGPTFELLLESLLCIILIHLASFCSRHDKYFGLVPL